MRQEALAVLPAQTACCCTQKVVVGAAPGIRSFWGLVMGAHLKSMQLLCPLPGLRAHLKAVQLLCLLPGLHAHLKTMQLLCLLPRLHAAAPQHEGPGYFARVAWPQ